MADASRPPSWVVLSPSVDMVGLSVEQEQEWAVIMCSSRKAYGCGEHGQKLVDGLTLLAHTVEYPNLAFSLRIRINDQALQIVRAELDMGDEPLAKIGGRGMHAIGAVHYVGESLVVLVLLFSLEERGERIYYLVYDDVAGSLSMIGHPPPYGVSTLTPRAVSVSRSNDGVDLLLVSRLSRPEFPEHGLLRDDVVLCACPLGPPDLSSSSCCSVGPWQLNKRRYREHQVPPELYSVQVEFSFNRQAFWADLSRRVVRYDTRTPGDRSHHVDFDIICLPPGFQLDSDVVEVTNQRWPEPLEIPVTMFRTTGHAGVSVKFVSLGHPGCRDASERMVTVWTLHQDQGERHRWWWSQDERFSVRSIWGLEDYRNAGLPKTQPKCPVLLPDGALCFLLPNQSRRQEDAFDDHVCFLDMRSMRIRWSGRVRNYGCAGVPILPSDFFYNVHPCAPSRRNLPSIVVTQDRRTSQKYAALFEATGG